VRIDCELSDSCLWVKDGLVKIKLKLFGAPIYYGWYYAKDRAPTWVKVTELEDGSYKIEEVEQETSGGE